MRVVVERMKRPLSAVPPDEAAVAMAVLRGARTMKEVARACGYPQPGRALYWLRRARKRNLVAFEDHRIGTLRTTLRVVER